MLLGLTNEMSGMASNPAGLLTAQRMEYLPPAIDMPSLDVETVTVLTGTEKRHIKC
jgi:hypothetical protein